MIKISIRNTLVGGTTNWQSGESPVNHNDFNDTNDAIIGGLRFDSFIITNNPCEGIVMHSSSKISYIDYSSDDIYNSQNSGASWTQKNTALDVDSRILVCRGDRTHAVAIEASGGTQEVAFTDDSGVTWSTPASTPTIGTACYDISFTTPTLIVVAGDDAAGTDHIMWSSDDGANWTAATTQPDTKIYCIDMVDANVGFAVDSSSKIWKTINAAVAWTDTGHTAGAGSSTSSKILAVSATEVYIMSTYIQLYSGSANATTVAKTMVGLDRVGGITKIGSNIFALLISTTKNIAELYGTSDNGSTWNVHTLSRVTVDSIPTQYSLDNDGTYLYIGGCRQYNILKILPML